MGHSIVGRLALAALLLCSAMIPVAAHGDDMLRVTVQDRVIATIGMPDGTEICLHWAHSVTGGAVADCFVNRAGCLVLDRAYLHDFAAGLGEVAGRGNIAAAADGGYWITGMNEKMPDNRLALRIGPARIGHRLDHRGGSVALSRLAPDHRAEIRLDPTPPNDCKRIE